MAGVLSDSIFFAVFIACVSYYYPELVGPANRPKEDKHVKEAYDFVIVGAGSAGCVLANRLSEVENWNVAIIEAGGDETPVSQTPLFFKYLINTPLDWNYTTAKQKSACLDTDGICLYPRARVVGGCSSVNAMWYVRGNKADYDGWEESGLKGWGYKDVLPYFKKAEDIKIEELSDSEYHSQGGPLTVSYSKFKLPMTDDLLEAGEELGLSRSDYNGERQNSVTRLQLTVNGPRRWSASTAYLLKASRRPNVSLVKNAQVTRVIIDPVTKRATGVEYIKKGVKKTLTAKKEVILSAGAINSPQLLMLSGIGHRDHLTSLNIPVVKELPVGDNLQDHLMGNISFHLEGGTELTGKPIAAYKTARSILDFAANRTGPLTTPPLETLMFVDSLNLTSEPPNAVLFPYGIVDSENPESIMDFYASVLNPKSKGTVRLRNADPLTPPIIDPNYYSHPDDMNIMVNAYRAIFQVMKSKAMEKYSPKLMETSACFQSGLPHDKTSLLECLAKQYSVTIFHPVGTAKMGLPNDITTVVDSRLKVLGVDHLRVIDASVIPTIPRANTNAPVIMIAEKASDIIKRDYSI